MHAFIFIRHLLLLILLLPAPAYPSDSLARRTHLGLQFDLSDREGPGLLVQRVLPGSTAEAAGIRPGDRLTSAGDVEVIRSFSELRGELARIPAGTRIPLRWYRGDDRVIRVAPPLTTLPVETMPGSVVRYDAVRVDGIGQRLILSEPVDGNRGLVFYLSGLSCASYDFWYGTDSAVKRLLDGWAAAGFRTARLEKRGEGDSQGPACSELSFEDERRGYAAAIARLVERGYGGRIVLFGHGLGGVIAPLVVTDSVAGVMVYGTVSEAWYEYMMRSLERQDRLAGLNSSEIERRQALRSAFQKGLLHGGETPAELTARMPEAADLPEVRLADDAHYGGRSVRFFVELAAVDPARVWSQVWQPVLALHGEYDWRSTRADHERIARLTGGRFESLPGLDDGFLRYGDLTESFSARGTGEFDPAVVQATLAWMETLSLNAPPAREAADT